MEVLKVAEFVSLRSDGAFDITVGPLVEAWGFGSRGAEEQAPSERSLQALLSDVGYRLLVLDAAEKKLRKTRPAVEVDLSAIAKGYGVDRIAEALDGLGHHEYLVELGGELRARGQRLDGNPWRVAIEKPSEDLRRIHQVLELKNRAMATSGDYRNYYELDGRRISHTLDPRSGRPLDHSLASVSVLHERAVLADAWATALNVLGENAGYTLAIEEGLAAYFITRSAPGKFESRSTPSFAAHLAER
jgi:thiamine biosynthesis lipoprotein